MMSSNLLTNDIFAFNLFQYTCLIIGRLLIGITASDTSITVQGIAMLYESISYDSIKMQLLCKYVYGYFIVCLFVESVPVGC